MNNATDMTQKQLRERRRIIVHQLCEMSRDGWRNAKMSDYQPLEAELRKIEPQIKRKQS